MAAVARGMDLKIFPPNELEAVLRALRAVAVDNASFSQGTRLRA